MRFVEVFVFVFLPALVAEIVALHPGQLARRGSSNVRTCVCVAILNAFVCKVSALLLVFAGKAFRVSARASSLLLLQFRLFLFL